MAYVSVYYFRGFGLDSVSRYLNKMFLKEMPMNLSSGVKSKIIFTPSKKNPITVKQKTKTATVKTSLKTCSWFIVKA